MKTAIVYVSTHHQNTKKLADAISQSYPLCLIDGTKEPAPDLSGFDCIGFASGIAFGKFYPEMLKLMERTLPENKKIFFLFTCGTMQRSYTRAAGKIAEQKHCSVLGEYGCLGYDTFGPFKWIGGIAKGHPDREDTDAAVRFYEHTVL